MRGEGVGERGGGRGGQIKDTVRSVTPEISGRKYVEKIIFIWPQISFELNQNYRKSLNLEYT